MEKTIIKFTLTGVGIALVMFALMLVDMAFLVPATVVLSVTVVTGVVWTLVEVLRDPMVMGSEASPYLNAANTMSALNTHRI